MESSIDLFAMAAALINHDNQPSYLREISINNKSKDSAGTMCDQIERNCINDLHRVPREECSKLRVDDFITRYEQSSRPVVISGCTESWNLEFFSIEVNFIPVSGYFR